MPVLYFLLRLHPRNLLIKPPLLLRNPTLHPRLLILNLLLNHLKFSHKLLLLCRRLILIEILQLAYRHLIRQLDV